MKLETLRHSLSHIMAAAVQELYPGTKFGIGPAIEDGFYYDFDFDEVKIVNANRKTQNAKPQPKTQNLNLSTDDLPKIEKKMKEIIKKDLPFRKKQISKAEANKIFKNQPYKLELIEELARAALKSALIK